MNRIILIGNGFDLAHNMPTSYKNFIDDYWAKIISELADKNKFELFENDEIKIVNPSNEFNANNYSALLEKIAELKASKDSDFLQEDFFKNKFFKKITEKNSLKNWVDIESEYYDLLKNSLNSSNVFEDIDSLNEDFEAVKNLLIEYLKKVEIQYGKDFKSRLRIIKNIGSKIYSPIFPKDLNEKGFNHFCELILEDLENYNTTISDVVDFRFKKFAQYFESKDISNIDNFKKIINNENPLRHYDFYPENTLLLNFNYTDTHLFYSSPYKFYYYPSKNITNVTNIQIHGSIDDSIKNPIIFGYGDEQDDYYINLKKSKNNGYLENIKGFKYNEIDNYKKTLKFLDSNLYQVFLMGHSCGASDRTLLKTIFEHDNCVTIKPFFYKKNDGSDNYNELVFNISRIFSEDSKMKNKLVIKSDCEPLS